LFCGHAMRFVLCVLLVTLAPCVLRLTAASAMHYVPSEVARHLGQRLGHLLSQPGEKENDLLKQQNAIQEKLTELAKRETEVYRTAFEKEKELTDRALKLAEVGKPKSNWELQGLLGLAAFAFGFLAGK
jgi:hypothetical protein